MQPYASDPARHRTGREATRPSRRCSIPKGSKQHRGRARGGGHAKPKTSGGHHKPGSVSAGGILADGPAVAAIHLGRRLLDGSSSQPGSPGAKHACLSCERRETPIRPCSGWGLPCGCRCRPPGALLPHPFTLACPPRHPKIWRSHRRFALCGTFPCPARKRNRRALPATLVSWSPDFPRTFARGCLRPPDGWAYRPGGQE